MLEQIVQLAVIVAGIFGGFSWLINFLQKKFQYINSRITSLEQKLDDKVTESICKERRAGLPCCTSDGTFKCPVPAVDPALKGTLDHLCSLIERLEQRERL